MKWKRFRFEVQQEIMKTDIAIEIHCPPDQEPLANRYLQEVIVLFRDFEQRYSRFRTDNELWELNASTLCVVSDELFTLLKHTQDFSRRTDGLFNPAILPALEKEGYTGAYTAEQAHLWRPSSIEEIVLGPGNTVTKPEELKIDLGGIGKGFIVDKVSKFLAQHFENFLVDAGGDIFAAGQNKTDQQAWGIDVENPFDENKSGALLLLTNKGVATSGNNRRTWQKNSLTKHHLIHPETGESFTSDIITATVIAEDTMTADVFAKTLFLLERKGAQAFAQKHALPAILITRDKKIIITPEAKSYVWNN